ncbi:M48 family metalloprotease [Psychrobacter sp.]|uniref:M48 family metalloprotease n=1 Tax=Psychrobacter sp. TaxID=56811 RepID=UPI0025CCAFDE|nr:M48 family metalloprotease [Psychrobacter sp.]
MYFFHPADRYRLRISKLGRSAPFSTLKLCCFLLLGGSSIASAAVSNFSTNFDDNDNFYNNQSTSIETATAIKPRYDWLQKSSAYTITNAYAYSSANGIDSPQLSLPELGSGGGRFIEVNQHKALGEWSLQKLANSAPLLDDPWSQEQLEALVWQINAQARTQAPLALMVINNASINAFAIPGGVMGIHTGTIINANSIDEVASVVAHEVAHLSQRHYEHRDEASRKALMMQIGGLLAAIAASAADGNAAAAVMMGSQTAALNSQMAFSRSNEREADRIGMQLMAKAGYDPRAMPRFFATLDQKTQLNMSDNAYLPSFIMTHPLSSERLSEAQSRANSYPTLALSSQRQTLSFELLKWRLQLLTNQTTETDLVVAASKNKAAELALAYWYAKQNRYMEANNTLNQLKQNPPIAYGSDKASFDILLAITEAQVAGLQGKWQEAEKVIMPYYAIYPERRDLKLLLADTWLQLGKYDKVITIVKPIVQSRPYDLDGLYRLQRAYELMAITGQHNNDKPSNAAFASDIAAVSALRYRAKGELWRGKYTDALVSLNQAKKELQDLSNSTKTVAFDPRPILANIDAEIAEVKTAKDFRP